MKRFVAFSIFILIIITVPAVSGQTLNERMQKAGKIYFRNIPHSNTFLYVVLDEAEGTLGFSGAANLRPASNEKVKVTNSKGEYQGEVMPLRLMNNEFIDRINSEFLNIFKKHLPPDIEMVDATNVKDILEDQYFVLEFSANNSNAKNQWLIQKTGMGSTQDLLFCYNEYDLTLKETKTRGDMIGASSKDLISLNYKLKYSSMKVAKDIQPEAQRLAYADLEKMIIQSALDGVKDFEEKSQKSLTKAMAK